MVLFRLISWFVILAAVCVGQTSGPGLSATGALVKIQVKPYADKPRQGLSRKRFFLIKGSREQNKSLIESLTSRTIATRDCFYTNAGASKQFLDWLKENDCESVYCGEIADKYIDGEKVVPEFQVAFEAAVKEFGNRDLSRKWLTVNLPDQLRNGFYLRKQKDLSEVLRQTVTASAASVQSVMTDRNGTAYFTNVPAGEYVISSLIPIELETSTIVFNCELSIKTDDVGTEKPVRVQKQNKKCEIVEKPLPACSSSLTRR
ncbi:MAG TPA: hypothetical protein VJM12_14465 [Pyrinomonadaceae bacterium]|nr:hypothetical protein [Pyrinomonadaceae bacterium]